MNNQEAIIKGVVEWMDGSSEVVRSCIEKGSERAFIKATEIVGIKIAEKVNKFLDENREDIITAIAAQMAANALNQRITPSARADEPVVGG